jgi:hypothetical protein
VASTYFAVDTKGCADPISFLEEQEEEEEEQQ